MSATLPATPEVIYPDSDGEPMGDNSHQIDLIIALYQNLTDHFAGRTDVAIHSNLLWYPVEGRPDIRRAPDVMIAFGRPAGRRRSYRQWEEEGIPPQVVFEIYAPGNEPRDLMRKFFFYEKYGVEEYYIFDPDGPSLTGWVQRDGSWDEVDPLNGFSSPRLGLTFAWDGEADSFDLLGPNGNRLPTHEELMTAYHEEQSKADEARQRADRLAAELRRLGIDPDAIGGGAP